MARRVIVAVVAGYVTNAVLIAGTEQTNQVRITCQRIEESESNSH